MASTVIGPRVARPARFFASTNGKKIVMGVTGFILFAFVVGHMMGNMQIYAGAEKFNAYGHFLHGVPELLCQMPSGLLASMASTYFRIACQFSSITIVSPVWIHDVHGMITPASLHAAPVPICGLAVPGA